MKEHLQQFYPATSMPDRDWWQALWPDPEQVMRQLGAVPTLRGIDLCCGDGYFTVPLARLVQPAQLTAVDLSPEMLQQAREAATEANLDNIHFMEGEAGELPRIIAEPVDWVFIGNTFHGVPDQTGLARAVHQVLRPGGRFVILNWHARPREETPVLGKPRGPATELRMTPESTRMVVEPAGFEESEVIDIGPYHYAAFFTRR